MIHVRTMGIVSNWWVSLPTAVIATVQDILDLTAIKVSNIMTSSWLVLNAWKFGLGQLRILLIFFSFFSLLECPKDARKEIYSLKGQTEEHARSRKRYLMACL